MKYVVIGLTDRTIKIICSTPYPSREPAHHFLYVTADVQVGWCIIQKTEPVYP